MSVGPADVWTPASRYGSDLVRPAYRVAPDRIHPVHNGAPPELFGYAWQPSADRHTRPALFFGRFERSKGLDTLLRALRELGRDAPRMRLVGRGPDWVAGERTRDAHGLTGKV